MSGQTVDLAIVGGGINGCGIARDAAGRGLSVFLCEERDLGGATSSASTKLIHGGLRYLEQYDFRLVHEALAEREVLLRSAPHIIQLLRFVLPHHAGLRPWPVIRLGLFVYDHLGGGRTLPGTKSIDLTKDVAGVPLKKTFRRAFEYSDCRVDDARLVILNARDAAERGADIRTRTRCIAARREGNTWRLTLHDARDPSRYETVTARALVNAGGPWVSDVIVNVTGLETPTKVRLVKGSHIVLDKLFDHDRAYIFQNADGRVCFAIPYERDYTLIGTTDEDFTGDPAAAEITDDEVKYLVAAASEYFETPVRRETIRWVYSGVRPLHDDGATTAQTATRDYMLELDAPSGSAPMLSVYGGKITTHRRLSEQAVDRLRPVFPEMGKSWTKRATLPGGDVPAGQFGAWTREMTARYRFLEPDLVARFCRAYGTRIEMLLSGVLTDTDLGRDFGAGLTEHEVTYLMQNEWAVGLEDVIWRRTKLGLRLGIPERIKIAEFMGDTRAVEINCAHLAAEASVPA
jgi:glycerol-3-phosphate dehydrogenase